MSSELQPVWAPVVSGIAAALLTLLGALWIDRRGAKRKERQELQDRRRGAAARLLSTSGLIVHTAGAMHVTLKVRSGVREGLEVTTGARKPVDPLEIDRRMRVDLEPLYEAWTDMWTVGTPEAIPLANVVVAHAGDVMGLAIQPGEARSGVLRVLLGEKWTEDQMEGFHAAVSRLADSRRELAERVRDEVGLPIAALFPETPEGEP